MNKIDPTLLAAEAFSTKLKSLAGQERTVLVEFLRQLEEFDRKKLYEPLGFPSLFAYCSQGLRFSNGSAFRRLTIARLLRRFPVVADFLCDGRLNLARVHLLREVLTEENHRELLERATHGTEKDVELIVATLKPKPDVADSIRKLPAPTQSRTAVASTSNLEVAVAQRTGASDAAQALSPRTSTLEVPVRQRTNSARATTDSRPVTPNLEVESQPPLLTSTLEVPTPPRREPRMQVHPTSATAWSVKMTVSREFIDEFEQVKAALSHKFPDGNFEDVLRECFRVTLEAVERRRSGAPRKSASAAVNALRPEEVCGTKAPEKKPSRYIPTAVRRAVWKRDGGCCAFVSADGRRCGSRHQVEIHHLEPFATGGASTEANLSLRCRGHNHYEAVLAFGAEFMESRVREPKPARRAPLPDWKCGSASVPGQRRDH